MSKIIQALMKQQKELEVNSYKEAILKEPNKK